MMHSRTSAARTALSGALLLLSIGLASPAMAQTRSIEGTYQLVSRTLADGTVLKPPAIMGLQTYTKTHRNFNLLVKDNAGTFQSFSYVSTYRLTNAGYSETFPDGRVDAWERVD